MNLIPNVPNWVSAVAIGIIYIVWITVELGLTALFTQDYGFDIVYESDEEE